MTAKAAVETAKASGVKVAISLSDPFVVAVFGDALREVIGVDLIFAIKTRQWPLPALSRLRRPQRALSSTQRRLPWRLWRHYL